MDEPIPLGLLCDMAWRIVVKEDGHAVKRGAWIQSVYQADWMIREAYRIRETTAIEEEINEDLYDYGQKHIKPLLKSDDFFGLVAFGRGCQIITGESKEQTAIQRFGLAYQGGWLAPRGDYSQFKTNGFELDDLAEHHKFFAKIPKNALRKPYERTGRFKTKYQNQKKKILEKSKKLLAGTVRKKRPNRGGISRA